MAQSPPDLWLMPGTPVPLCVPSLLRQNMGVGRVKGKPAWRGAVGGGRHRKAKARPSLMTQIHTATHMDQDPQREGTVVHRDSESHRQHRQRYTEAQPDVGCQMRVLSHTQPHIHSQTASDTVSPRQGSRSGHCAQLEPPRASRLFHPQPYHPTSLPRRMGQRGQQRGLAQRPAAKRGSREGGL